MLSPKRIILASVAALVVLAFAAPASYAIPEVQTQPPESVIPGVAMPGGDPLPPPPPPPPPPPDEPDGAEPPGVAMPGGDPLPPPPPDPKL